MEVDVAITGAGILGLAHALAAAKKGLRVVVFERSPKAAGASVRNFGMIWPIGQPAGAMRDIALRSREIWLDVLDRAKLAYFPTGSLHLAYRDDEAAVAQEFAAIAAALGYECEWLNAQQTVARSNAVRSEGLRGALWSPTELTVDPRRTLAALPKFLEERYGVQFRFGTAVQRIDLPTIEAGGELWRASAAIVCGGDDFETLYPAEFRASGITRCKLQMMRTGPQHGAWKLGPALAAGLTLRFYPSFGICSTLPALRARIARELPDYERFDIHVMVSQTLDGELTIGDSHEYGLAVDIFNKSEIDDLILRYAATFLQAPDTRIAQRWHGVYAKHPTAPFVSITPAPNIRVVTGVGGSGMTLSFGLAEHTLDGL